MPILITDESLTPRLASTLRRRGRDAVSVASLGHRGHGDPSLLREIVKEHAEAVLITADDSMPKDHPEALTETGIAVATIDPGRLGHLTEDEWQWETVHRWAHQMARQPRGTWRRYGKHVRPWAPRPPKGLAARSRRPIAARRHRVSIRARRARR